MVEYVREALWCECLQIFFPIPDQLKPSTFLLNPLRLGVTKITLKEMLINLLRLPPISYVFFVAKMFPYIFFFLFKLFNNVDGREDFLPSIYEEQVKGIEWTSKEKKIFTS